MRLIELRGKQQLDVPDDRPTTVALLYFVRLNGFVALSLDHFLMRFHSQFAGIGMLFIFWMNKHRHVWLGHAARSASIRIRLARPSRELGCQTYLRGPAQDAIKRCKKWSIWIEFGERLYIFILHGTCKVDTNLRSENPKIDVCNQHDPSLSLWCTLAISYNYKL